MKDLISAIERMIKDEKDGAKKYNQLSRFFKEMGMVPFDRVAREMASDEYQHEKALKMFIRSIQKLEIGSKGG